MERLTNEIELCVCSPARSDLDLIAVIDGEAPTVLVNEICDCPSCSQRAQRYSDLQLRLRARLYRCLCPTSDELMALHQKTASGTQQLRLLAHVQACRHCQHELRMLEAMFTPLQSHRQ
jgi:hypothetical protein